MGIDLVIGKPRCFLNRAASSEHGMCSEDTVYVGANGLTPPTGWYHPAGPGLTPGTRFPDGHVPPSRKRRLSGPGAGPVRRLAHEKLWVSDAHKFLRKETGLELFYSTTSDAYCRANNVDITLLPTAVDTQFTKNGRTLSQNLCSAVCPKTGAVATVCNGNDLDIDVSDPDTTNFALCGYTREECEDICTAITECSGFDITTTQSKVTLANGNEDLVPIERTPEADGTYFQASPPAVLPNNYGENLFLLPGTTKKLEFGVSLPSLWAVVDDSTVLYAIAAKLTPAGAPAKLP